MTLYVDASALLKIYLDEPDRPGAERILRPEPVWVTARHTSIEVRRNLVRDLSGADLDGAREEFDRDWAAMTIVELTPAVCEAAAALAEMNGLRTLDALHLGAAKEAGAGQFPIVTYDRRQAQAARALGWTVLGL